MAAAALDGVVAGSLGLMAVVAWQLGKASIVDRTTLAIFAVSLIALLRFRVNSAWVVASAAAGTISAKLTYPCTRVDSLLNSAGTPASLSRPA